MARFLICVWPYAGHLHPCLALAERLRETGHQTAFYTGSPGADLVAGEGHEYLGFCALARYLQQFADGDESRLYRVLNERYTTLSERTPWGKLNRVRQFLLEMTAGSLNAQWKDLREVVRDWRPDVVITDPMLWAPIVAVHERMGIPVVPFSFYAGCLVPGRGLANAGLGLPPAEGWAGTLRNRAANRVARVATVNVSRLVNEFRRSENLPPIPDSVGHHSGRMPLYIAASSPEFDYGRTDLRTRLVYAGSCLWEPEAQSSDWNTELPIVYVSEGTAQVGRPFLISAAVEALAGEKVEVVVTTGRHRTPHSLGLDRVPSNVRLLQWISHRQFIPRTRAVVTTGGSNTVRQTLVAGVPVLAVPLEWDQLENAQRLVRCGAGIRIARPKCTAMRLRGAVRGLLDNATYRQNARRIGESFRRLDKSRLVIERLEALAHV